MATTLQLVFEGEVASLTLNRPEKRNAISPQMIDELQAAFDSVESSSARVMIMTGAGKAFCSGMDLDILKSTASQSYERNLTDSRRTATLFRRLWSFPRPTIAAVNGSALAGGCGLATLCDFTLAAEDAKFGYTEVRVGFMPALVSIFLQNQLGDKVARDLLLTGRILDAQEAFTLGLVTRVIAPDKLLSEARDLATSLLALSPSSLLATKRLLLHATAAQIEKGVELGIDESAVIRSTADFREGLAAFVEKRKPKWSGS